MSSSDESDSESFLTPPDLVNAAKTINENLLPAKSKERYLTAYDNFISWREEKNAVSFSENVLLAYFGELANKYKPPSLWAIYSMLKMTLKSRNNVNIEGYPKLSAYLKRMSDGYVGKKSKVLTGENVENFIDQAPDEKYLATKVALVLGVNGALRRQELAEITTDNIEDHGTMVLVKIPNTKNKIPRSFVVQGKYYELIKKYQSRRSIKGTGNRFFQNYRNGKCIAQFIGKNKFGGMHREIAEYLQLPDANLYTGHTFRRTSATLLADSGADITTLKRHGGWKSSNVAEGYIEDSLNSKKYIGDQIAKSITKSCGKQLDLQPTTSKNETICGSTSYTNMVTKPQASTSGFNSNAGTSPQPEHTHMSKKKVKQQQILVCHKILNYLKKMCL